MIVLGIDPGTAVTGYGAVRREDRTLKLVSCGVIRTSPDLPFAERLLIIHQSLINHIEQTRPDRVAVEEVFFSRNARSAFAVGQARGAAIVTAAGYGLTVCSYTPLEVKMAVTGYGRADKQQVAEMVKILLGVDKLTGPPDVADALAVAICCIHTVETTREVGS